LAVWSGASFGPSHRIIVRRIISAGCVNERRVEILDRRAMQMLAQFQLIRPARIPLPEQIAMY
jgi:hypothetical protein